MPPCYSLLKILWMMKNFQFGLSFPPRLFLEKLFWGWGRGGRGSRCLLYIPLVTVSYFLKNHHQFIGNKAKGRISKQWLQENKPHQISWKTKISYTLTHTYCGYQGVGSFSFSEIWLALVSCNHEIRLFDLLPTS